MPWMHVGGIVVDLTTFNTAALCRDEWSALCFGCFIPKERVLMSFGYVASGPWNCLHIVKIREVPEDTIIFRDVAPCPPQKKGILIFVAMRTSNII
jgi:hypothetical protein